MKLSQALILTSVLALAISTSAAQSRLVELTASDGSANQGFGGSVTVSANTIVVGSPAGDGVRTGTGAAYVFVNPGSGWVQVAKLTASDGLTDDGFGSAVAISADTGTIAIGAPSNSPNIGKVYVFVEPPGGWVDMTETAQLTQENIRPKFFGYSLAISTDGSRVVPGSFGAGAFVFVKPQAGWVSMNGATAAMLPPPGAEFFGTSLAMKGNTVVVGADTGAGGIGGAAYVYQLSQSFQASPLLNPIATLTPTDGVSQDLWTSVAIANSTIVAGAPVHNTSGAVYVFVEPPGGWTNMTQTAELSLASTHPNTLGSSVATSGKATFAGAPFQKVSTKDAQGALFGYAEPPGGWTNSSMPNLSVTPFDGAANDRFGTSIARSGKTIVIGAPFHAVNGNPVQGAAYVLGP